MAIVAIALAAAAAWIWSRWMRSDQSPDRSPVPLRQAVLHDVQGLWGGQVLWVAADGTAVVQMVGHPPAGKSGLWERRYHFQLPQTNVAEIERILGARRFLTLKVAARNGVPDEPRVSIAVVTKDGKVARVSKWERDRDAGFDELCTYLRGLCVSCTGGQPQSEGAFDWNWHPDGFERTW